MEKLVVIPKTEGYALTPKLWLAVGLLAYNHHLLTLRPLELLTPDQVGPGLKDTRHEELRRGLAILASVERMSGTSRSAFVTIARQLLVPIGVNISLHGNVPIAGEGHSPRYVYLVDTGGQERFQLPEGEEGEKEAGPKSQPRGSSSSQRQSA
jgi:hypothetical protein